MTAMKRITASLACVAAALVVSACTVSPSEAPSLTGPSEFALSVAVTASPDTISQDGQSLSTVGVSARDANGRPLSNVAFRLDLQVDGEPSDYGTLSVRTIVTGSDGRATATYRAPAPPPAAASASGDCGAVGATLGGRCVRIIATAVGSNFDAALAQSVLIHLVPTSVIVPPSATPEAKFTIAPSTPAANTPVQFDASPSCAARTVDGQCPAAAGQIASYMWNFGDGTTGTGRTATHTFRAQQTYLVTLTVTNDRGLTSTPFTQSINVGAGAVPTAAFTASPTAPQPGQAVHFDASVSKAGAGHNIVRYVWNFGDGAERLDTNTPTATHIFASEGTYIVTLNIADEVGQVATVTGTVKVAVPEAATQTP